MVPATYSREIVTARRKTLVWTPRYRRGTPARRKYRVRTARGRTIPTAARSMLPRRIKRPVEMPEYPEPIAFDRELLARFEESTRSEWIETNGLGGYASSTIAGANTRQYHGLLVVPYAKGGCRYVMLAKVEETLRVGGQCYELSSNRYPGAIHPEGHLLLREFRIDPVPTYIYEVAGIRLEKKVFMVHGSNTVVISYCLSGAPSGGELRVRPTVAAREFHSLALENYGVETSWDEPRPGVVVYRAYPGTPRLHFSHNANAVVGCSLWYRQVEYDMEAERGLPFREDLFVPFSFTYGMVSGLTYGLIVSTDESLPPATDADRLETLRRNRQAKLVLTSTPGDEFEKRLAIESSSFLVSGEYSRTGVISGYHWFGEYCRDTLISLPGLTLVSGRYSIAREILTAVSAHFNRGMLPNRFNERTGQPEYTSADASLWFIQAVQSYLSYTSDYQFVRDALYSRMTEVIEYYRKATGRNIIMDRNGLLDVGTVTNQMTWMNISVAGKPVTPRHGKAVEINALWYNALKIVADLARRFGDERAHTFATLATVARRSFQVTFWNENGRYLYDYVRQGEADASIRPNQIFALSLSYPLLEGERATSVVDRVEKELLTPFGLRTLSARDPRYRGRYEGGPQSRDEAYHQGTVWAWLLGPFISAYVRVYGRSQTTIGKARGLVEPFRGHLREAGLGTVSEIFDGDPPHSPRGCISKAVSVAELLRAYREEILGNKPTF